MTTPIPLETHHGLYLPDLDLWLDPDQAKENAFVSHAHADHFARHRNILCSTTTATLLRHRYRVAEERLHPLDFRNVLSVGDFRLQLFPAGHILGSAMLHVTRTTDGASLLYTGDFKVRPGFTAEEPVFRRADTLVMETTYGKPEYVFPPLAELSGAIRNFVEGALEDGSVPVLFGYSLGKAQEAVALLAEARIPCLSHHTVAEMTDACRAAGAGLPAPILFEGEVPPGHALVCPPSAVRSKALRALPDCRMAFLSGWALAPGARFRYRVDEVFPLSDHADYPGLLECVHRVGPARIVTLHGFAREFAADLRERGWEAWSIHGDDQIELNLGRDPTARAPATHPRPTGDLQQFSDLCDQVRSTSSRNRKREFLAAYLARLSDPALELVASWLSGRALPPPAHRSLRLGTALIRRAVLQTTGLSEKQYRRVSSAQADPARTARILLEGARLGPQATDFAAVRKFLESLAGTSATLQKADLLAERLRYLHPRESETLVALLTGDLRIGLREGLLEEAVADAFQQPATEVRRAHMLLGNLGQAAILARHGTLHQAHLTPFAPLKCMLASPESSAQSIWARLAPETDRSPSPATAKVWNEDKFDGIRAQLHKAGDETALFSRDLRSLRAEFPELLEAAGQLSADLILDGEIIAYAEGRRLNFFDLQKRLGRTKGQGDLFLGQAIPVRYLVFDLLWLNGQDLLEQPLALRRLRLESLDLPREFELVEVRHAASPRELESCFKTAVARGNEGLIVKDAEAPYRPGRRGKSWLKLKDVMPTLDCVVVAAQQGHGKRAEVLSDYTFAVRDQESGQLLTVGKAYSGLTDQEIEELTEFFKQTTVEKKRRVHQVEPSVVLEIAFDSIQRSRRHNSGLALRFPRIVAIRRDKTPDDIDTLQYAESLLR